MKEIGTITKIEEQKNNPERVSIFVDGDFLLGIAKEIFLQYNLSKGDTLTENNLFNLASDDEVAKAKSYALNLLSYRKRSELELRERLEKKDYSQVSINQVIKILKRIDYLDDREFAKLWIRDKQRKSKGPLQIKIELSKKGVAERIIAAEISNEYPMDKEKKIAREFISKRVKRYHDDSYQKKKRKLFQALERRGFSFDIIHELLEEFLTGVGEDETFSNE